MSSRADRYCRRRFNSCRLPQKTMKLTQRQKTLLFEAFRRHEMCLDAHERSKPMTQQWLGLGTEAAYRPALKAGLMRFHDGRIPPKRCMGWLCLTDEGFNILKVHETEFQEKLEKLKIDNWLSQYSSYNLYGGITR